MKTLLSSAAAAAAVGMAALAVPAGAAPTPCSASGLAVSFIYVPGSNGAGNLNYTLKVRNTSAQACSLGRPTLTLLGKTGTVLPSHARGSGAPVTVAAGRTATALARFSPDVPGTGDHQGVQCEPVAYRLRATFAGSSGSVTGPIKPPTPVCERGSMLLEPLKA